MEPSRLTIVIARGDVLGDVVVTTPMVVALKKHFPSCKVYYLIRKSYAPLFENDPRIEGIIEDSLPYDMTRSSWPLFFQLVKQVRAVKADIFIGSWEKPRYGLLSFLAGISVRIGHRSSFWNRLFYTQTVSLDYLDFALHKVDYNLSLLKPLGVDQPYPVQLVGQKPTHLPESYIVVHLDAGNIIRVLFKEQFLAFINPLLEQTSHHIVLIGTSMSHERATYIEEHVSDPARMINLVDALTLEQLKDVIAGAQCVIGSDSGPVHIASGFHRPVVVYYLNRIQNACHWGPWMTPHRVVTSNHDCIDVCSPQLCQKTTCREMLNPEDIVSAYQELCSNTLDFENQHHYWLKKTATIGLIGDCSDEFEIYLREEGWRVHRLNSNDSLRQLKQICSEKNINLFIVPGKTSVFFKIKIIILQRWVSNFIAFLPKIITSDTAFDFELKTTC